MSKPSLLKMPQISSITRVVGCRSRARGAAGQGGIEAFEGLGFEGRFQSALAGVEQGGEALLDAVGLLTHGGAFRGGGSLAMELMAWASLPLRPRKSTRSPSSSSNEEARSRPASRSVTRLSSTVIKSMRIPGAAAGGVTVKRNGPEGRTQQRRRNTMSRRHMTTGAHAAGAA